MGPSEPILPQLSKTEEGRTLRKCMEGLFKRSDVTDPLDSPDHCEVCGAVSIEPDPEGARFSRSGFARNRSGRVP